MKNKLLKTILTTCLVVPCALSIAGCDKDDDNTTQMETWDGTFTSVSKAEDGVITIDTAEELAGFAKSVNEGTNYKDITIKLAVDMDMKNRTWTPIGFGYTSGDNVVGKSFDGTFDGNNKTIYNLDVLGVNAPAGDTGSVGVGFFGLVRGAIKNLTIDTIKVTGNHYVGGVVGYISDTENTYLGTIDNVHVKNATINCSYLDADQSGDKAGAIVGMLDASSLTNSSASNSTITANRDAGQLVGMASVTTGQDFATGNKANEVTVSWDNQTKSNSSNTNIRNQFVGRQ